MKKLGALLATLLFVSACHAESFKGNEYKLIKSPDNTSITIGFDKNENRFFGKIVNNYFGSYQVSNEKMTLSQVGSTMMMGPTDAMAAEQQYFKDLSEVTGYQLTGDTLILFLKDDKKLSFEKIGSVKSK